MVYYEKSSCGQPMTGGQIELSNEARVASENLTTAQWLRIADAAIECHKKGVKDFDVFITGHLREVDQWEKQTGRKLWPQVALSGDQIKETITNQARQFGQLDSGRNPSEAKQTIRQ